jgi:hypothetical protein
LPNANIDLITGVVLEKKKKAMGLYSIWKAHAINLSYLGGPASFLDGVDSHDGHAVSWHNPLTKIAVTVELQMTRQFTVRYSFRGLLQFEDL